jgi:hypothetical protein
MNNWDTHAEVKVRLLTDLNIPQVTDYHTYDDDTKTLIDQTMGALQDHIDNVPREADTLTYRVGRIIYKVTYTD